MQKVRLGLIGHGNMGANHAAQIVHGRIPRLTLAAVAESEPARRPNYSGVRVFPDPAALMASGLVDAVLIATPHPTHAPLATAALKAGLHVLLEKPFAVHKAEALPVIAAAKRRPQQVFGIVFNQRTDPYYRKIRDLVRGGTLGPLLRLQWTVTNWFRPEAYYKSGGWRATWAGEGGGLLLNQCPHNLDLLQWIAGMPVRVRAHCQFGRYHDIEVEDDVSAHLEYKGGAHATFIASTGEAPGTNRLELALDGGRLVYEHDQLVITRNAQPASVFSRTSREFFLAPATTEEKLLGLGHGGQHSDILANFTAAILDGAPLIAPAPEGLHSLELANAMLFSAWTGKTIDLPLDAQAYEQALKRKIATARAGRRKD
jgi:predicted dehydrogenase